MKNNARTFSFLMIIVVFISTVIKLIYVFFFTDYKANLVSDSGCYWRFAQNYFMGNIFEDAQWNIWPPLYHTILGEMFKMISFFGFLPEKHEIILVVQILLSSASVYVLYLLALDITRRHLTAFLAASTYAFSYGIIYFNSFILSENLAIPLAICSIWLLFRKHYSFLILSGVLLALATGMRPVYAGFGCLFAFFLFLSKDEPLNRLKKVFIFGFSFLIVITLIVSHNYYVSQGKLKGLASNGGVNSYLAFTKLFKLSSHGFYLVPPATVEHPENGSKEFQEQIYDNAAFYKLTNEYIKNNPKVLLSKFNDYKQLIFGIFIPYCPGVLWFKGLIMVARWQALVMSLFSLMIWIVFMSKTADNAKLLLITSIFVYCLVGAYFVNPEFRYYFTVAFVIHIMFFASLIEFLRRIRVFLHVPDLDLPK